MTGAEDWSVNDATASIVADPDVLAGTDTETTIGSSTHDDFLFPTSSGTIILEGLTDFTFTPDTQIDLANFGLGFENEWIDIPSGSNAGISDLLITPFGDLQLLGTAFSDLASVFG